MKVVNDLGPTAFCTSQAMGKFFENPKKFWKFLKFVLQWHLGMKSSPCEFHQKICIHLREIEGWKLTNFDHPNEIFSAFLFIIFEGLLNGNIKIVNFETFKILWSVYLQRRSSSRDKIHFSFFEKFWKYIFLKFLGYYFFITLCPP